MQISTEIQEPIFLQESSNRQESGTGEGSINGIFHVSEKKNKLGIFAKLLEGLSVKLTKGTEVKGTPGISGRISGEEEHISLKSHTEVSNEEIFSLLGQESSIENEKNALIGLIFSKNAEKNTHIGLSQNLNSREGLSSSSNFAKEAENSLHSFDKPDNKKALKEPALQDSSDLFAGSHSRAKNERNTNFLNASFRDLEEEFLRNQGWQVKAELNNAQLSKGLENENIRFAEPRNKRGKDRLNIEVRDLRTGEGRGSALASELMPSSREAGPENLRFASNGEIEIPVDLKGGGNEKSLSMAGNSFDNSLTFEDALAAQLRGDLSADIVRDASVIVRNGGEGTIRLQLRPASLGDVKIRLEMTENKITGHIIVESSEALRAFERELPVLEKAFKDSGFSETNLQMSLSQDGSNFGGREQGQEGNFLTQFLAISSYEAEYIRTGFGQMEDLHESGTVLNASPGRTPVNLLI